MADGSDAAMPENADSHNHQRVFYRPEHTLYRPRCKVIKEDDCSTLTEGWPLSESFSAHKCDPGSLLENNFPWQNKWYLRFDPPKSPDELGIGQYWRYEGPKLENFVSNAADSQPIAPPLTKLSLSSMKSIAVKILSGTPMESLVDNAYQKSRCGRGSMLNDRDGAASTVSSQLRMPESHGGPKRSILAGYSTSVKSKSRSKRSV